MIRQSVIQQPTPTTHPLSSGILQRKCASCGQYARGGECGECQKKWMPSPSSRAINASRIARDFSQVPVHSTGLPIIQTKLNSGQLRDKYEQEADRVVEQIIPIPMPKGRISLQPKLKISQPNDKYEREADYTADTIVRIPQPADSPLPINFVRRQSLLRQAEEKAESRQAREAIRQSPAVLAKNPSAVSQLGGSQGRSLPLATRKLFESRFGYDFSQVRIHTDSRAAQAADTIDARAFTIDRNIFFNRGEYCPYTESGRRLIAHELTHTIQQTNTSFSSAFQSAPIMIQRNGRGGRGRRSALAELMVRLQREGRLDPTVLPEVVDPIPPLPVTREELERVGGTEVVAAGLLSGRGASTARTAAQVVTRTARVLTVIEGGAGVGTSGAGAAASAGSLLRYGTAIGAFLTVLLTPSSTAPAWMDTVSQITRLPYATPDEYRWERNLTRPQIDYLREQASRPIPQPQPAPREEREEEEECFLVEAFPLGGNPEHDALAAFVTGQPVEYILSTYDGLLSARYDGKDASDTLYEIKTRHDFLHLLERPDVRLGPRGRRAISEGVPDIINQIENQAMVAAICGYEFRVATNNLSIVGILRELAPGITVEYVEFPWP